MSGEATHQPLVLDPVGLDEPGDLPFLGVTFRVRHCSPRKMREIRMRLGLPGTPPANERLSDEGRRELEDAILDWMLEGWPEGEVVDASGEVVACDLAGKRLMVDLSDAFADLLTRYSAALWHIKQQSARAELGNSRGSSSPDAPPTGTAKGATTAVAGSPTDASSPSSEAA